MLAKEPVPDYVMQAYNLTELEFEGLFDTQTIG